MGRRILVADDSSTILKVVKIAFSQFPVTIAETGSYVEALQEVNQNKADVLILDACLPGAKGPEDFVALSKQSANAPILLLVGSYQNVDEDAFRAAGLEGFLKKPFDSAEIVERVEALLGPFEDDAGEAPPAPADQKATIPPPPPPPTFSLSQDDDDASPPGAPPIAPPVLTEQGRRGRPAFEDSPTAPPTRPPQTTTVIIPPPPGRESASAEPLSSEPKAPGRTLPPIPPRVGEFGASQPTAPRGQSEETTSASLSDAVKQELLSMLPGLVREAVEDYCERHFKPLAREVITAELRRLADEKARHLVDQ